MSRFLERTYLHHAEPLHHVPFHRIAFCGFEGIVLFCLLTVLGTTILVSLLPGSHYGSGRYLPPQGIVVSMTATPRATLGRIPGLQSWDAALERTLRPNFWTVSWGHEIAPQFWAASRESNFGSQSMTRNQRLLPKAAILETIAGSQSSEDAVALSEFVTTNTGARMPRQIYGVSNMKKSPEKFLPDLVRGGIRGIDITREKKRVIEPAVGKALALVFQRIRRQSFFVQTKINLNKVPGADARLVREQLAYSLESLGLDYIDSIVLDLANEGKPHQSVMQAWDALEDAVSDGKVRQLGLSDTHLTLEELQRIHADAIIKPAVVKQDVDAGEMFNRDLQKWCADAGIFYQSVWVPDARGRSEVFKLIKPISDKYGVTSRMLFLRYFMSLGVTPINKESKDAQLKLELSARRIPLSNEDAEVIGKSLDIATYTAGERPRELTPREEKQRRHAYFDKMRSKRRLEKQRSR